MTTNENNQLTKVTIEISWNKINLVTNWPKECEETALEYAHQLGLLIIPYQVKEFLPSMDQEVDFTIISYEDYAIFNWLITLDHDEDISKYTGDYAIDKVLKTFARDLAINYDINTPVSHSILATIDPDNNSYKYSIHFSAILYF